MALPAFEGGSLVRDYFKVRTEGRFYPLLMETHDMACCDCGLVHTAEAAIKDGQFGFIWRRNDAITDRVRKRMKRHGRLQPFNGNHR